jgi:hypothetical protein
MPHKATITGVPYAFLLWTLKEATKKNEQGDKKSPASS